MNSAVKGEIIHNMNLNPFDIIPLDKQSSTIIVKNLLSNITEEDLTRIFSKYGVVEDIKLFNKSKINPPCACVTFENNVTLEKIININSEINNSPNIIRFDNVKLLLLINEDTNKVKRDIDRINRPEHLAKLLQKKPEELQNHFHFLLSNHMLSFMAQSVRVREIWVGNLPTTVKREDLSLHFSQFGEIDNIHHYPKHTNAQNFAFIRYKSTDYALNALNNQEVLSKNLGISLRMSFADFLKRYNIAGDDPKFSTPNEKFSNILIILYNQPNNLPNYKFFKDRFKIFGKVKNILYRPSINQEMKSYILIEMENVDQVKRIRKYYNQDDHDGKRKLRLGDSKCEINILIKPNISANLHDLIIPYLPKLEDEKENNLIDTQNTNKNMYFSLFWSGFFVNSKKKEKKKQVGTDAFLVYGNEKELLKDNLFNLNINQKININDFLINKSKKEPKGVVIFRSSNDTQNQKFNELVEDLKSNNEIGIINQIDPHVIYLIPYNNISKNYVNTIDVNDLVGVFLLSEKEEKLAAKDIDLDDKDLSKIKEEIKKNPNLYQQVLKECN